MKDPLIFPLYESDKFYLDYTPSPIIHTTIFRHKTIKFQNLSVSKRTNLFNLVINSSFQIKMDIIWYHIIANSKRNNFFLLKILILEEIYEMTTRFKKNGKNRGHVSTGHDRIGKHNGNVGVSKWVLEPQSNTIESVAPACRSYDEQGQGQRGIGRLPLR
ncbi:hypothetical protein Scep_007285 [Stephania cephalantha]|uniref:Uncharacterized protein n=1 Tax=Stephania cephalantha TaxID=152367 RepID=A0AAP0K9H6_9MAGN